MLVAGLMANMAFLLPKAELLHVMIPPVLVKVVVVWPFVGLAKVKTSLPTVIAPGAARATKDPARIIPVLSREKRFVSAQVFVIEIPPPELSTATLFDDVCLLMIPDAISAANLISTINDKGAAEGDMLTLLLDDEAVLLTIGEIAADVLVITASTLVEALLLVDAPFDKSIEDVPLSEKATEGMILVLEVVFE